MSAVRANMSGPTCSRITYLLIIFTWDVSSVGGRQVAAGYVGEIGRGETSSAYAVDVGMGPTAARLLR